MRKSLIKLKSVKRFIAFSKARIVAIKIRQRNKWVMLIAIIGENCAGKTTLANAINKSLNAKVFAGKDYLRLAKNESIAKAMFQKKLNAAVSPLQPLFQSARTRIQNSL